MKVTLFMAISLNGVIAANGGGEDFLSHENWLTFVEISKETGCIIWGRKTHEIVRGWEKEYIDSIKHATRIIVTNNINYPVEEGCFTATSPEQAINMLESRGFSHALLSGGGTLNSAFMEANLIDEIIVNIEPALIGQGIQIFQTGDFHKKLKFLEFKQLNDDIIQLHYQIIK